MFRPKSSPNLDPSLHSNALATNNIINKIRPTTSIHKNINSNSNSSNTSNNTNTNILSNSTSTSNILNNNLLASNTSYNTMITSSSLLDYTSENYESSSNFKVYLLKLIEFRDHYSNINKNNNANFNNEINNLNEIIKLLKKEYEYLNQKNDSIKRDYLALQSTNNDLISKTRIVDFLNWTNEDDIRESILDIESDIYNIDHSYSLQIIKTLPSFTSFQRLIATKLQRLDELTYLLKKKMSSILAPESANPFIELIKICGTPENVMYEFKRLQEENELLRLREIRFSHSPILKLRSIGPETPLVLTALQNELDLARMELKKFGIIENNEIIFPSNLFEYKPEKHLDVDVLYRRMANNPHEELNKDRNYSIRCSVLEQQVKSLTEELKLLKQSKPQFNNDTSDLRDKINDLLTQQAFQLDYTAELTQNFKDEKERRSKCEYILSQILSESPHIIEKTKKLRSLKDQTPVSEFDIYPKIFEKFCDGMMNIDDWNKFGIAYGICPGIIEKEEFLKIFDANGTALSYNDFIQLLPSIARLLFPFEKSQSNSAFNIFLSSKFFTNEELKLYNSIAGGDGSISFDASISLLESSELVEQLNEQITSFASAASARLETSESIFIPLHEFLTFCKQFTIMPQHLSRESLTELYQLAAKKEEKDEISVRGFKFAIVKIAEYCYPLKWNERKDSAVNFLLHQMGLDESISDPIKIDKEKVLPKDSINKPYTGPISMPKIDPNMKPTIVRKSSSDVRSPPNKVVPKAR